jgi:hypothetical protein
VVVVLAVVVFADVVLAVVVLVVVVFVDVVVFAAGVVDDDEDTNYPAGQVNSHFPLAS